MAWIESLSKTFTRNHFCGANILGVPVTLMKIKSGNKILQLLLKFHFCQILFQLKFSLTSTYKKMEIR